MEGFTGADVLATNKTLNAYEVEWLEVLEGVEDSIVRGYIKEYWRTAVEEYDVNGYRPSLKVAQALVECAAGRSSLAKNHNAHFGIKAYHKTCRQKGIVVKKDDGPRDKFNTYVTGVASWHDHTELIGKPRYKKVRDAETLEKACMELGVSGYATSKYRFKNRAGQYVGKPGATILNTIKKYNLEKLDRMVGITE